MGKDGRPIGIGPGQPGYDPSQPLELPEHCLVRLIDVTVKPGKTYEYRMQVRMANPNHNRRDVASVSYAELPELLSDWSSSVSVAVPHELRYYAVDQKEIDKSEGVRKYVGTYTADIPAFRRERQIMLQVHRWLDAVRLNPDSAPLLIGAWTAAERVPVYRGEYVGRKERTELPVWRFSREEFVIATDTSTSKFRKGVEVPFGFEEGGTQPESILVDFHQGRVDYLRNGGAKVTDDSGLEALLLNPDGRLLLLEGARDQADEQRKERLKKVRTHIEDVKHNSTKGGDGPKPLFK
jgi:hypothetical protein